MAKPEIFASGLRNPWQFNFDPATGDMYIADVGQLAWEEINYIPAADVANGGQNFGWDIMEASHCYPPVEGGECSNFGALPVAEFAHGDAGCSITGIGIYRGETSPVLENLLRLRLLLGQDLGRSTALPLSVRKRECAAIASSSRWTIRPTLRSISISTR